MRHRYGLGGSLPDPGDVTAQVQAQVQAQVANAQGQINALQGQAQASWNNATSQASNAQRIANGAKAAEGLLQNGYDPTNQTDNQAIITTVAAGLSLIPVVGPFLGGALMLIDLAAQGIADALQAIGIIPAPHCDSSGGWTAATVLGSAYGSNLPPQGSFALLAAAALAQNAADKLNCTGGYANLWILAAVQNIWNAGASGPPQQVWVPALNDSTIVPMYGNWLGDPTGQIAQNAFKPVEQVPLNLVGQGLGTLTINGGPFVAPISGGQLVISGQASQAIAGAPPPSSTAATVVKGAALVAGATAAGIGVYALLTHQAYKTVASKLWEKTGGKALRDLRKSRRRGR